MSNPQQSNQIRMGFEPTSVRVVIEKLMPVRTICAAVRNSRKYAQIANSIREVGLVEPPVVTRQGGGRYLLLDGHIR